VPRFVVLTLLLALPALAEKPRLGVVIIVDQLSAETFNARMPKLTGGIKRLATEGYVFNEARYEAAPTITSVGHATIMTGAYGQVHGIVSNDWLDAETGKPTLSTQDPAFTVLGRNPHERDGTSPLWLRAPTLADAVKASDAKALSLSISAKDRSAILCAGHAGLAVWFDVEKPFFTTSTFYAKEVPAFLTPVNERFAQALLKGTFAWGLPGGGITGQAPQLPTAARIDDSEPFAERKEVQAPIDTAEVDVALDGVKALGLGQDEIPDLLTISFSGHDRIGHAFGPDSPEGLEEYLHVDKEIGRLLAGLDALVGKGKYVVVFTSDHGVAPIPEQSKGRGLDAGRVDVKALMALLDAELDKELGRNDWFFGAKTPGLTFNAKLRKRAQPMIPRLQELARAQPGVFDLIPIENPKGPLASFYEKGAFVGRSPDLVIVSKPYWTTSKSDVTGHASPWLYDRAVPMIFFGANVKKGQGGTTEPIHAAPTLSRLLGIPAPAAAQGRALDEVIR
jgi:predicted AlkP superfamily pyrophosphatase or phosphodiesterase